MRVPVRMRAEPVRKRKRAEPARKRKPREPEDDFLSDFDADEWDAPAMPRRAATPARRRSNPRSSSRRPAKSSKKRGSKRRSRGSNAGRTLALLAGIPMGLCLSLGLVGTVAQGDPGPLAASISIGISFALLFVLIGSVWRVFEKAGQPGWAALVPILNIIALHEIAGVPKWLVLGWFIPFAGLLVAIPVYIGLARNFGQSVLFGLGLFFFGFIFFPLLAFGDYEYEGSWSF